MEIITDEQVASLLGQAVTPAITLIVELTNDIVTEAWDEAATEPEPVPIPARVKALALNVAVRAAANPKGLSSWTRSWDDVSRTERAEGGDGRLGVYLTDDEIADLNGLDPAQVQVGTIRTPTRDQLCRTRRSSC